MPPGGPSCSAPSLSCPGLAGEKCVLKFESGTNVWEAPGQRTELTALSNSCSFLPSALPVASLRITLPAYGLLCFQCESNYKPVKMKQYLAVFLL